MMAVATTARYALCHSIEPRLCLHPTPDPPHRKRLRTLERLAPFLRSGVCGFGGEDSWSGRCEQLGDMIDSRHRQIRDGQAYREIRSKLDAMRLTVAFRDLPSRATSASRTGRDI